MKLSLSVLKIPDINMVTIEGNMDGERQQTEDPCLLILVLELIG